MIMEKFINNQYFLRVEVVSMSVEKISLYFLGGDPIQYFGLDPIDPRSSFPLKILKNAISQKRPNQIFWFQLLWVAEDVY